MYSFDLTNTAFNAALKATELHRVSATAPAESHTIRETFIESALAFVEAASSGVSDNKLAMMNKAVKPELPRSSRERFYSSATSVGYHRRTGLVLMLGGELPPDIEPWDIQTMIKQLPNGTVDTVIARSNTTKEAVDEMERQLGRIRNQQLYLESCDRLSA